MKKSPFQDGSTVTGKSLDTREIVIEGTVRASSNNSTSDDDD